MSIAHGLSAVLVWSCIVVGLYYFVLLKHNNYTHVSVFLNGTFFGFVVYAVYELTNFVVLKQWSFVMVIVDILWGMFACGLTSLMLFLL